MQWFIIGAALLFVVLQYDNLLVILHHMDPDHSLPPELRLLGLVVMFVVMTWAVVGIRRANETIALAKQGQSSPHKHGGKGQYIMLGVVVVLAVLAYLKGSGAI